MVFAFKGAEARSGPGGAFRITGLHPIEYELTVVPHSVGGRGYDYSRIENDGVRIVAPAYGVSVEARLRPVLVEVYSEGKPIEGAIVRRSAEGGGALSGDFDDMRHFWPGAPADRDGTVAPWVDPEGKFLMRVESPGFETLNLVVSGEDFGPDRRLRVQLVRSALPTRVEIELVYDAPDSLEGCDVTSWLVANPGMLRRGQSATVHRGVLTFPEFPPGEYQVHLDFLLMRDRLPDEQPYAIRAELMIEAGEERALWSVVTTFVNIAVAGRVDASRTP